MSKPLILICGALVWADSTLKGGWVQQSLMREDELTHS